MERMLIPAACLWLAFTAVAGAVDLNRLNSGSATIVEEFGTNEKALVKPVTGDKSKEKELVKPVIGDNAKAKDLVKPVTGDSAKVKDLVKPVPGDSAKEKELVKPVLSNKEKERLLVKEIVPLETAIFVTPSRSRLFHAKLPIDRFSISNPNLIEVIQYSPLEFELLGRNPGACSLTIWLTDISGGEQILRLGVKVGRDDGRD